MTGERGRMGAGGRLFSKRRVPGGYPLERLCEPSETFGRPVDDDWYRIRTGPLATLKSPQFTRYPKSGHVQCKLLDGVCGSKVRSVSEPIQTKWFEITIGLPFDDEIRDQFACRRSQPKPMSTEPSCYVVSGRVSRWSYEGSRVRRNVENATPGFHDREVFEFGKGLSH